jgi:hypothetical protein
MANEDLLARLEKTDGLRIFWWNIENGGTDQRITTGGCPTHQSDHPLERNLVALARSSISPDVIGLSEYAPTDPNGLSAWAIRELERIYPYRYFNLYGLTGWTEGVGVFSKFPLSPRPREELGWAAGRTPEEREANRQLWNRQHPESRGFDRPYLRYESSWRGKPLNLVFEHLADPWPFVRENLRQSNPGWLAHVPFISGSLESLWASAKTGADVFFKEDSPLFVQARELLGKLTRDFGPDLRGASLVLTGDLNAPSRSTVHRLLTTKLKDSFGAVTRNIPFSDASFPATCAETYGHFPPFKIDHSLLSRMRSNAAEVLYLHGSDHYPLYVIVEPML